MWGNSTEGLFTGIAVVVIFVFVLAISIGIFIGKSIWDNDGFIESKTKIEPAIRLTTDGKKIDTLYVYKLK
jgi:hypothetical protein